MKTTHIAIGLGALVAAAGVWFGREVWLERHDFISLNVRNAPIAEVARILQGKMREKLSLDPKLDGKVTINVKHMPLPQVLDLIADQSGARWGKTYAVYRVENSLRSLEGALRGDTKLDEAGWTNLAPRFERPSMPSGIAGGDGGPIVVKSKDGGSFTNSASFQSPEEMQKFLKDQLPPGASIVTDDVQVGPGDGKPGQVVIRRGGPGPGGQSSPDRQHRVMVRMARGPNGAMTTTTTSSDGDGPAQVSMIKTGADGVVVQEDVWSQERLAMETPLMPQLNDAIPETASLETAAATAGKVHGKYAIYYALEKSPAGMGMMPAALRKSFTRRGAGGPMPDMDSIGKENMLGGIGTLTPEQQVQRARQMKETHDTSK